ncbi:hypothetical protein [Mesorhizobium sp. B4-1-1]|uniref:hypothetical protein n=1 Tax=Mesorhizobium sp. B4-1-1 TaxID=2589890 RepID=UPI0011264979|nr:hypothetical protein [Mesorhizobium sp. B4-1-1]TPI21523.1 hypothetical protein FJW10_08090 [Mesorhizobium sp. B4-1-1]
MAPREAFLGEWLRQPRIALLSAGSSGIAGYGVARRCREGFKVGSLFADATDVALARVADLPDATAGKELHVDVPAGQVQFTAMLQAAGLVPG